MPTQAVKTIKPLLCQLDNRQQPDVMPIGTVRSRVYLATVDGKLARAHGFRRFLDRDNYCNQDLHDQLLPLQIRYLDTTPKTDGADAVEEYPSAKCGVVLQTPENSDTKGVEHVTLLREIQTAFGSRYLLAGTQSRLYLLNETTGNWRLLADGLGGESNEALEVRWRVATLKDRVIATNKVDRIQYWQMDDPVKGCDMQAFQPVDELNTIEVYQAKVVVEYMGYIVLMNIFSGGTPLPGTIQWSGRNLPLAYDPVNANLNPDTPTSQELPNQVILNAVEFEGLLAIFTDQGIWAMNVTGGDPPFDFSPIYKQAGGLYKCLAYPNTLVSTGEMMFWCGRDQIYSMSGSTAGPITIEWIKNASKKLFDEINKGCCESHVAYFNPITEEIWISYASGDSCIPNQTLVLNLRYQTAYYRPEGYTAFAMFRSDARVNFRDFLWQNCVCTPAALTTEYVKEGLPCVDPDCEFVPDAVFTADYSVTTVDPDDTENPIITEDYDAPQASEHSLCALLGGKKASDFCGECNEEQIFVGASAQDKCLKDIGTAAYSLEVCQVAGQSGERTGYTLTPVEVGAGSYVTLGYDSAMVFGPIALGDTEQEVSLQWVNLFYRAELTAWPCAIGLTVGVASVPLDSNESDCPITWHDPEYKLLECINDQTPEGYKAMNERPILKMNWPLLRTARYVYLKFEIVGLSQTGQVDSAKVPAVGGVCDLYTVELRYQSRK